MLQKDYYRILFHIYSLKTESQVNHCFTDPNLFNNIKKFN